MERRTVLKLGAVTVMAGAMAGGTKADATTEPRTHRLGPFLLVDPPPGQLEVIQAAYAAIAFPWERLDAALNQDPDRAVLVEWDETGQSTSGLFYGHSLRIVLSTRSYHLDAGAGFVFAHEVGHLVDRCVLTEQTRQALTDLFHASPGTHRYDGEQMNGAEHPWSHNQPHSEAWVSGNSYPFRLNEAYADAFVQAFAPAVWDGSFYPGAPTRTAAWVRFVHTTQDHARVRAITLEPPVPTEPKPVQAEAVEPATPTGHSHPQLLRALRRRRATIRRLRQRVRRLRRRVQ